MRRRPATVPYRLEDLAQGTSRDEAGDGLVLEKRLVGDRRRETGEEDCDAGCARAREQEPGTGRRPYLAGRSRSASSR